MQTNRQKKIAGIIQKDLAEIIQEAMRESYKGIIISVTKVRVTSDLGEAKVYISMFPTKEREAIFEAVQEHNHLLRHKLAQRTRHQLRRVPELHFFIDDSLDYIDDIEKALRGELKNPIKNPDILPKRKKM